MSCDDDEERKAAAEAKRQQEIEDNLAERGHIIIGAYNPRFRDPKYSWEQGYDQKTHE